MPASTKFRRRIRRKKCRGAVAGVAIFTVLALLLVAVLWQFYPRWDTRRRIEALAAAEPLSAVEYLPVDVGRARSGLPLAELNGIVIHYVGNPGTTARNNRNYFAKEDTEVCSHFVVGLEGEIVQCLPLDERSAASNHRNRDTISIEVCHPDKTGRFNPATYDSLVELTAWLCREGEIPPEGIIRHYDVTGKLCPLYYVEHPAAWEAFLTAVKTRLAES